MSDKKPVSSSREDAYCKNCYHPLAAAGKYCHACGQKAVPLRVRLTQIARETLETVINFDSRLLRTLSSLFIPGRLTQAYFQGQRQRYLPPVRIFLLTAIAHFAVLGYVLKDTLDEGIRELENQNTERAYFSIFLEELAHHCDTLQAAAPAPSAASLELLDTLEARMHRGQADSMDLVRLQPQQGGFQLSPISVSLADIQKLETDSLLQHYHIHGFFDRLVFRQSLKLAFEGSNIVGVILGNLIWMVILMMPALALILKLLYIRADRYFVEHLVFSYHYHAFAFVIFSLIFLLSTGNGIALSPKAGGLQVGSAGDAYWLWAFVAVLIYQLMSMRRLYEQPWKKTLLKSLLLNFSYLFIFVLFLLATFAFSALTF
jgi:hypothetical protein